MSQQSARAAWIKSNGDDIYVPAETAGILRPTATPVHGCESQKKAYGAKGSDPSAGGANAPGKDSSNCDDALGNPGKHRGSAGQAKEVSGEGPKEVKKQNGEIDAKFPATSAGYN